MILPASYTLSSSLINISPQPVASGGSGNLYEATLGNGSRVFVKHSGVYLKGDTEKATKVCLNTLPPSHC